MYSGSWTTGERGPTTSPSRWTTSKRFTENWRRTESPPSALAEPFPNWKEMYVHPKHAFGTLIQFAEFNPLDWINPGYIPPSYAEFAPPHQVGPRGQTEVRRVERKGPEVEIRQGEQKIRVPLARVEDLMQTLKNQQTS